MIYELHNQKYPDDLRERVKLVNRQAIHYQSVNVSSIFLFSLLLAAEDGLAQVRLKCQIGLRAAVPVSDQKLTFLIYLHMKANLCPIMQHIHLESIEFDHMLCQKFKVYPSYLRTEITDHAAKLSKVDYPTGHPANNKCLSRLIPCVRHH